MTAADVESFVRAAIEYCVIVGGAFTAAFLVYLFMSE